MLGNPKGGDARADGRTSRLLMRGLTCLGSPLHTREVAGSKPAAPIDSPLLLLAQYRTFGNHPPCGSWYSLIVIMFIGLTRRSPSLNPHGNTPERRGTRNASGSSPIAAPPSSNAFMSS